MAIHNLPEERQVIKLLEKIAFVEADRQVWVDEIQATGLTEELAEQIHQKLAAPVEVESQALIQAKALVEFSQLVRRWRMARGAKKFH
jgi:hypothetical protein